MVEKSRVKDVAETAAPLELDEPEAEADVVVVDELEDELQAASVSAAAVRDTGSAHHDRRVRPDRCSSVRFMVPLTQSWSSRARGPRLVRDLAAEARPITVSCRSSCEHVTDR
jgi:hypothetical protein